MYTKNCNKYEQLARYARVTNSLRSKRSLRATGVWRPRCARNYKKYTLATRKKDCESTSTCASKTLHLIMRIRLRMCKLFGIRENTTTGALRAGDNIATMKEKRPRYACVATSLPFLQMYVFDEKCTLA
jgi:hypothetical protein